LREHREATKGTISDVRNWGGFPDGNAGTLVAGGFLGHFTAGQRWAHVDMSNTSWAYADQDYNPQGATAYGTRLLVDFFENGAPAAPKDEAGPRAGGARKRRPL
jgi:leucyl aminopeptidase